LDFLILYLYDTPKPSAWKGLVDTFSSGCVWLLPVVMLAVLDDASVSSWNDAAN